LNFTELWNLKYAQAILGVELGDINNDGKIEIVAYTKSGTLIIISQNGKLLHQETLSKNTPIWHLKIFDIDNDGENELISGGMDGILNVYKSSNINILEPFWKHKFNSSISGFLLDDINNDNINEIIAFSLDKTLRVLNSSNGDLVWGQIFEDGIGEAIVFTDHKYPFKKEIIACGNDGTLRSYNACNGELLWFKLFANNIRCISFLNSINSCIILCGGDDKQLYFLDKKTLNEIKIKEFNEYVWKCISYPDSKFNKAVISSYSFDYLDKSIPFENIEFESNLICINEFLDVVWEIKGYNIEFLDILEINAKNLILVGTTKGELILIEEETAEILLYRNNNSCINMIQFHSEDKTLFCCHDNGSVIAYKLEGI
jgi:WD40 repeat protein